jgi:transposase-like protein
VLGVPLTFVRASATPKQHQPVTRELKQILAVETAELAAKRLEDFAEGPWGKIPGVKSRRAIVQSWRRVWEQVIPFFAYPKEIRKVIYTTSATPEPA